MNADSKQQELADLQRRVQQLEREVAVERTPPQWQAKGFYGAYYATTGFMLGMFGAAASLLFNIIGSLIIGQDPLELVRVYLTFPLGDRALELDSLGSGISLAVGCCLYLGTGMLLGIPFQLVLARMGANASFVAKFIVVTALAIAVWLVNYYGILSWLQPAVVPDMSPENLIVNRVPPWVAASTHLVFGWTMLLVSPLGLYAPYRRETEKQ